METDEGECDLKFDVPFKDLVAGQLFFVMHNGPPLLFIKQKSWLRKRPYATLVKSAFEKWMGSENYCYTSVFWLDGGNENCWLGGRRYRLKPGTPTSPCFLEFLFKYRTDRFTGLREAITGVTAWMQMIESKSFYDEWMKVDPAIDCPCTPSVTLKEVK